MHRPTKRSNPWTIEAIPDLSGRIAVVTGANSGIGLATAWELARRRATVVLACRSLERGRSATASIQSEIPKARCHVMALDLADLASVRQFAATFNEEFPQLDVLVNNAGVLLVPFAKTIDGFEQHMGINHLGHFALTGYLMSCLLKTAGSRVVTVSSLGHRWGRIDWDDLWFEHASTYTPWRGYARSKLANLLFTFELQRRLASTGTIAVAAHPGGAATNLGRNLSDKGFYKTLLPWLERLSQSATQGALPLLRAATDPAAQGGDFFGPSGRLGMRGHAVLVTASPRAYDSEAARRLWRISEQLTDVQFDLPA